MLAVSVAERDGVLGAVAKYDGALDPGHLAVGLAGVRVRGEGLELGRVGAPGDEVARHAADGGLAHDDAVLARRNPEGEGLGVLRRPSRRDGDGQGRCQDLRDDCVCRGLRNLFLQRLVGTS